MNTVSKKSLGVFALVMINVIAVDSLRTLPFSAEFGFSLVFYYLLAALIFFIPIALVSAELATGWPNKGGIYVWVREAFGEKWGFFIIWLQWIYNIVWYPTILSFIAGTFAYLIDPALAESKTYMLLMVLGVFWGATLVNYFGMRLSSAFSTFTALVGTLIPMAIIIGLAVYWLSAGKPVQIHFDMTHFFPHINSISGLTFIVAILFGLVGIEMSAVHADEVKDPGRAYPRAIFLSAVIILATLICASLAIAMVVPHDGINTVTALVQAFHVFFGSYHMQWMNNAIILLIIIGGIGTVAAWIIGPTKGLLVAVQDGSAPPVLGKTNKKEVPVVILFLQGIIFTVLCSVFLFMPNVSSSYWLLTAMTAQLAMVVYVGLFIAAIKLRCTSPDVKRAYKIPGGLFGLVLISSVGMLACIIAILLGFVPPESIDVGNIVKYESILIVGILLFCAPPFIIYAMKKPAWLGMG